MSVVIPVGLGLERGDRWGHSSSAGELSEVKKLTVPYAAWKPFNFFSVPLYCSAGTMALRTSFAISQSLTCSSFRRTTMRVDWELKDEGTWRRASVTISWILASEMGDSFLSW